MMNTVRKWIIWIWREVVQPKLRPSDRKLLKMCISGIILLGGGKLSFYCYGVTIRKEEEGYQAFFDLNDNPLDICTVIVIGFLTIITIALIVKIYLSEKKRKIPDTLVVTYSAMIAADRPQIDFSLACKALPKTIMPLEHPFEIKNEYPEQDEVVFWEKESTFLEKKINELFTTMSVTKKMHVSLFALAPMPLLIKLGSLLNEKYQVDVYQKHRNPDNWNRLDEYGQEFIVNRPVNKNKKAVLVISISAFIRERINSYYGDNASIWEVSVAEPNMDMLRSEQQQNDYRVIMRNLLTEISNTSHDDVIAVHMAMPAACAVELGRVWMPKGHKPLELYDYRHGIENKTITLKDK